MAIPTKDLKILWAKAAGRCSMQTCRRSLVEPGSASLPSAGILVGESCHIVADSPDGPRGDSPLTAADRNRYPNLILLCTIHHTVIDQDPAAWPIELLHQTKADHELWVETQLTLVPPGTPDDVYAHLINAATEELRLRDWNILSSNLIRDIVPEFFMDGSNNLTKTVLAANWPGTRPALEAAIRNFAQRVNRFLVHFAKYAELIENHDDPEASYWRVDLEWKRASRMSSPSVRQHAKKWEEQLQPLLADVIVAVNEYADAVRQSINRNYFLFEGKFLLVDSLGVTNEMVACTYLPDAYSGITDDELVD